MTTQPQPTPEPDLTNIFQQMRDAVAGNILAKGIAAAQASYYQSLIENGINEPTALQLSERAMNSLLTNAGTIMAGLGEIGRVAPEIIDAIDRLLENDFTQELLRGDPRRP